MSAVTENYEAKVCPTAFNLATRAFADRQHGRRSVSDR